MKKIQLFLVMLLVSCLTAAAQSLNVSGKVTYSDDGSPVIGATIYVKGSTDAAVMSDLNGEYRITIPATAAQKVLVFTFAGLKEHQITVTKSGEYNVQMEPDATRLEDAVVIGYGSGRRAGSVVGSVVKVDAKAIENRPTASVMDALQGKVPGLQIYTSSGRPGDVQSIRLHGEGSITASSTPLYILDGIQVDGRTVLAMNPNDFQSVQVLKDASATSIYGSRAANGVIVYTSKRGVSGEKGKITARFQYGMSSVADKSFYDNMMSTDQLLGFWQESGLRSEAQIQALINNLKKSGTVQKGGQLFDTRWMDYILPDNRPTFSSDISFQGGGKNVSYFISAAQYHEEGLVPGELFDKYNVRSNIDGRLAPWAKIGMNLALSLDKSAVNANWGGSNTNSNYTGGGLSFLNTPYTSPVDSLGNRPNTILGSSWVNQYYWAEQNSEIYKRYGVLASAYVELEPVKNLKIRSNVGVDYYNREGETLRLPTYSGSLNNGYVGRSTTIRYNATITNTIEYSFNIKDNHNLVILAGQEGISNNYSYYTASSSGQTDPRLMNLQNGIQSTFKMSNSYNKSNFMSFFGRVDYSYKGKYLVDALVRNDASSRFGANNQNALFWAVGAMWNISKEKFMQNADWISNLNLKVSYGTQGNSEIGDYEHLSLSSSYTTYNNKPAWATNAPGNPDLKWETQKKLTIAANATFWNRLTVGLEFYDRVTDDMLMNVPVPSTTGFTTVLKNVGARVNRGIDLSINYDILSGKDYYLSAYANLNFNEDKITRLFDGKTTWTLPNTGVTYAVGQALMYYYPIYAGVNPDNGEQLWYKPGDDFTKHTTNNGVTNRYDEEALNQNTGKKLLAPITGGFGLSGGWKGIGISADFSYALGKTLLSNDRYFSENPVGFLGYNTSSNVLDYWKNPGDQTYYPAWGNGEVMEFDSHLLENASFLRLKNLTVSYTLGQNLLGKDFLLSAVKVFFTARNLFTITSKDFKGTDPEIDSNLTLGKIANTKQFVFGIELTF